MQKKRYTPKALARENKNDVFHHFQFHFTSLVLLKFTEESMTTDADFVLRHFLQDCSEIFIAS